MRLTQLTLITLALSLTANFAAGSNSENIPTITSIENGFKEIPDSTRLAVYWYWLNDNLSAPGVVKDLESMKKAGINRAYIGFMGIDDIPKGNVPFRSDAWWNVLETALETAGRLDIEIGIFNSPGWSQSGGPWVKPEQSMRRLVSAETEIGKKGKQTIVLPEIAGSQDVAVVAYPAFKNNAATQTWNFKKEEGKALSAIMKPEKPMTARTLSITVNDIVKTPAVLKVKKNGITETVKEFEIDRYNPQLYVGFEPYAPIIITLPDIEGDEFVIETGNDGKGDIEITLSEIPMVERYAEKSLAKMFQEPLPLWHHYMWEHRPEISGKKWMINPSKVIDLTDKVHDGKLTWNVPSGKWIVSRVAMKSTGVTNSPAMADACGLEIDKLSKHHLKSHFDSFIGEILRRIPAEKRRTFKIVVEDSYETGGQNWTDDMISRFEQRYNYSPIPYLPVLRGTVVGNSDVSDRFLWDLRRLVADMVAYEYVGGLREISNSHGLTTWLENYGHWGFPAEFLQYGGQSDEIAGEFWSEGSLGDIENRAASSCGHIYGKRKIWAESCTSGGPVFSRYPAIMKQRIDRFFTEGINSTLLHLYIHQDGESELEPGLAAWFGNEFNRKNTWFDHMDVFAQYLKRCNHMLQQGRYVADVAYFIGEDAPKMTGVCDPELPSGYSFDYINAEILQNHARIVDGRLVLDSGMEYRLLVLPRQETMRPEMLATIKRMVEEGLTISGPAPLRSPSLADYPQCDKRVREMARDLWGNSDERVRKVGKGYVFKENCSIKDILTHLGVTPDFSTASGNPSLSFIHRTAPDSEIYFIANPSEAQVSVTSSFRIPEGMYPELWNPTTGECRYLPEFSREGNSTLVPLSFKALESAFIVFKKGKAPEYTVTSNFPEPAEAASFNSPWEIKFDSSRRGPADAIVTESLTDWSKSENPQIRNYSGAATYRNSFTINAREPKQYYIDLGKVMVTAKIKINGKDAGGVWTTPYRVNITPYITDGENSIEIEVINNWKNRLIGDLSLPEADRKTWTNQQIWKPGDELQESGLTGPVKILVADYQLK